MLLLAISVSVSAQCYIVRNEATGEISRISFTDTCYTKIIGSNAFEYPVNSMIRDTFPESNCMVTYYDIEDEYLSIVACTDNSVGELFVKDIFNYYVIIYNLDYLSQEVVIPVDEIDPEAPFTQSRSNRVEADKPNSK